MKIWHYLDQIEFALDLASALDSAVVSVAVLRSYMPPPKADDQGDPAFTSRCEASAIGPTLSRSAGWAAVFTSRAC
jgi:hypothetical protein